MKRKSNFFLSAAVALLTVPFSVQAKEQMPVISLSSRYASESSVTSVTASIDSEINVAAYSVSLYFDPTYIEFTDAECTSKYGTFFYGDSAEDTVTLIWSDSRNRTIKGDMFTVSFKTKSDSAGCTVPVEIGYSVLGSDSTGEIPFKAEGCEITILDEYVWGDSNCDGILSIADAVAINRFTFNPKSFIFLDSQIINSDTDGNGIINFKDCKNILKCITGI